MLSLNCNFIFKILAAAYGRPRVATAPPTCAQELKPSDIADHVDSVNQQSPDYPTSPRLREPVTDFDFSFQPTKPNSKNTKNLVFLSIYF